jgi:endonuclease/exonuclease/phosphatase family metal-dependent hydrolase
MTFLRVRRIGPFYHGRMRGAVAVPVFVALGLGACASARNYPDPDEPRFETRYGTATAPAGTIRVASFNLKFAEKVDEAIAVFRDTLALRGLDILALQEMDAEGTERIARALEMNSIFFPGAVHPKTGRDFGNALLSPWPLENVRKLILPHQSRFTGLKRTATVATVCVGAQRIQAYSVHIETPIHLSSKGRREQVQFVLDDAHDSPDPIVVAGDFNSRNLNEPFEEAGYLWVTRNLRDTSGWWELDHIFARGLRPPGPATAGVSADLHDASDHRPVWALLELE